MDASREPRLVTPRLALVCDAEHSPPRCVTNLNIGRPFDGSIGLENRCINTLLRISKECMQRYEVSCMSSPVLAASELTVLAKRRMPFRSAT